MGSVEVGKWADLVLWRPAFFGVKPTLILKGGAIAASLMGDANASIPTPQPVHYRPMFASYGGSLHATSLTFISQAAQEAGLPEALGLKKKIAVVKGCRDVQKTDLIHNDYLPNIDVDPQTYQVKADGVLLWCEPAETLADGAALLPVLSLQLPHKKRPRTLRVEAFVVSVVTEWTLSAARSSLARFIASRVRVFSCCVICLSMSSRICTYASSVISWPSGKSFHCLPSSPQNALISPRFEPFPLP